MRIYAIARDPTETIKGDGPVIHLDTMTVSRVLDGIGEIKATGPGTSRKLNTILTPETRFHGYIDYQDGTNMFTQPVGIFRQIRRSDGAQNIVTFSGPDQLDELKRVSVRTNLRYSEQTLLTVVEDLISKVSGWSATVETAVATTVINARFDTVSILKALQQLAKQQGLHFRLNGDKTIEFGEFGDNMDDFVLLNPAHTSAEFLSQDGVGVIQQLQLTQSSEAVANRIFPYGAGQNIDQALSLEKSTRTSPYLINTITENSRTLYYIEDAASVASYGVIEAFVQANEISPLTTSAGDVINAANAVYDFASEWLQRNSVQRDTYKVQARNIRQDILPGDKIRVIAKRDVMDEQGQYIYRDIDEYFWVLTVANAISPTGVVTEMEISNVDIEPESAGKSIHGALEAINIRGVREAPTQSHYLYGPEQAFINTTEDGNFDLPLTARTLAIDNITMRVRTRVLTSTSVGEFDVSVGTITSTSDGGETVVSTAGGAHTHVVGSYQDSSTGGSAARYQVNNASGVHDIYLESSSATDIITAGISATHTHSVTTSNHTHDVDIAGAEFSLTYGIFRDTTYPGDITITVNGVSVTPAAIGSSGSALDTTIDITDEIRDKVGGFQTTHDIVVSCASGQGEVLLTFDVTEQIAPFKVGS